MCLKGMKSMRVLAVGCHPDDLELSCGGTLARMVKEGYEVYTCHVCNGDMGHAVIMPDAATTSIVFMCVYAFLF